MPLLSAIFGPFFFAPQASFAYWRGGSHQKWTMIALSFLCDAGLQWGLKLLTLPSLAIAAVGAAVFLLLPHRLACAAATLAIVQMLPGVWAYGLVYDQFASAWADVPGLVLRGWGVAAFSWLLLSYIRTPKSSWTSTSST